VYTRTLTRRAGGITLGGDPYLEDPEVADLFALLLEERLDELHIETVLDILECGNLGRVWIERVKREVREGRRKVERTRIELHIVRPSESGTAYEDTIDHPSESDAGSSAWCSPSPDTSSTMYETLPFTVLDSLEGIDSDRIVSPVDYFSDCADYSVAALLSEDERTLDEPHRRVREI
jgi:hypothetical protein